MKKIYYICLLCILSLCMHAQGSCGFVLTDSTMRYLSIGTQRFDLSDKPIFEIEKFTDSKMKVSVTCKGQTMEFLSLSLFFSEVSSQEMMIISSSNKSKMYDLQYVTNLGVSSDGFDIFTKGYYNTLSEDKITLSFFGQSEGNEANADFYATIGKYDGFQRYVTVNANCLDLMEEVGVCVQTEDSEKPTVFMGYSNTLKDGAIMLKCSSFDHGVCELAMFGLKPQTVYRVTPFYTLGTYGSKVYYGETKEFRMNDSQCESIDLTEINKDERINRNNVSSQTNIVEDMQYYYVKIGAVSANTQVKVGYNLPYSFEAGKNYEIRVVFAPSIEDNEVLPPTKFGMSLYDGMDKVYDWINTSLPEEKGGGTKNFVCGGADFDTLTVNYKVTDSDVNAPVLVLASNVGATSYKKGEYSRTFFIYSIEVIYKDPLDFVGNEEDLGGYANEDNLGVDSEDKEDENMDPPSSGDESNKNDGEGTVSVNGIELGSQVVSVYSSNGIQRSELKKGMNVVKMSDGTVRKVMVR